jgi:hypothetical protein
MFHNTILEAKDAVVAQFGSDSSEAQIVGCKKKFACSVPCGRRNQPNSHVMLASGFPIIAALGNPGAFGDCDFSD